MKNGNLNQKKNNQLFNQYKKAWTNSSNPLHKDDIERDKLSIQSKINRELRLKLNTSKRHASIYRVAAAIALPIAFAISLYFINSSDTINAPEAVCEVISPKGHVSKCILPDGTEVWINAESKITYDVSDFQNKNRSIELEGEAYFEVVSDKKKSFFSNYRPG